MADEECCRGEIDALKQDIENSVHKVNKLKQEYKKLLIENLKKDVTLRQLNDKIKSKKYSSFQNKLSELCLQELKTIGNSQKDDAKFVCAALLYGENLDVIKKKTLSGRSKTGENTKFTPEKKRFWIVYLLKECEHCLPMTLTMCEKTAWEQ